MKTSVESMVQCSYIRDAFIHVPKKDWDLFPALTTMVELETDRGTIETQFYVGSYRGFSRNLRPWFRSHAKLEAGDTLRITIEQDAKYRLEILE